MKETISAIFLALILLLSGCSSPADRSTAENADVPSKTESSREAATVERPSDTEGSTEAKQDESAGRTVIIPEELFSDRDRSGTYSESESTLITLTGSSASCDSTAVQIDGSTVTITDEGTYILSGTLDDGMIIVNADKKDKTQLVLDGVSISSTVSAPIYVLQADKVFITLAENTENALTNGGKFEAIDENNIDAVIFSKEDLVLNGSGSLDITSPAGHGVVSKDELTLAGGKYAIQSASHGLSGKDNVCITDSTVDITAGKDGIHAENDDDAALGFVYIESGEFTISSEGDGISSASSMQIDDGTFHILSGGGSINAAKKTSDSWGMGGMMPGGGMPNGGMGGGSKGGRMMSIATAAVSTVSLAESTSSENSTSSKAIKASADLTINGGVFTIDAADDAVHSNSDLTVNGGTFDIKTGDDGFHADAAAIITSGEICISESYEGIEGLNVSISGGNISVTADDDGLNAAGGTDQSGFGGMRGGDRFASDPDSFINISGGTITIHASGDGIDSNGALEISGGYITVSGPTTGDTSVLDYGEGSSGTITGGTFIGTGAYQMAQTFSASEQGVISLSVGNQSSGTLITLSDQDGNMLISYEPDLDFAIIILSSPEMAKGETYTITIGSNSAEFEAN